MAIAAIAATLATPATAQEWRGRSELREVQGGGIGCALGFYRPGDFAGISLDSNDSTPRLTVRSRHLAGIAHEGDSLFRFPSGFLTSRMKLREVETDCEIALLDIHLDSDMHAMIDGFAVCGDFTIAVLRGQPTAFRLAQLPAADSDIALLRNYLRELHNG